MLDGSRQKTQRPIITVDNRCPGMAGHHVGEHRAVVGETLGVAQDCGQFGCQIRVVFIQEKRVEFLEKLIPIFQRYFELETGGKEKIYK